MMENTPFPHMFPLGNNLYVQVQKWKGRANVQIRYFFMNDIDSLSATRKGITFNPRGWASLTENFPRVKQCIVARYKSSAKKDFSVDVGEGFGIHVVKSSFNSISLVIGRHFDGASVNVSLKQWKELLRSQAVVKRSLTKCCDELISEATAAAIEANYNSSTQNDDQQSQYSQVILKSGDYEEPPDDLLRELDEAEAAGRAIQSTSSETISPKTSRRSARTTPYSRRPTEQSKGVLRPRKRVLISSDEEEEDTQQQEVAANEEVVSEEIQNSQQMW